MYVLGQSKYWPWAKPGMIAPRHIMANIQCIPRMGGLLYVPIPHLVCRDQTTFPSDTLLANSNSMSSTNFISFASPITRNALYVSVRKVTASEIDIFGLTASDILIQISSITVIVEIIGIYCLVYYEGFLHNRNRILPNR